jgi:Lipase (class 3)
MDLHGSVRIPHNSLFLAQLIGFLRQPHPEVAILRAVEAATLATADTAFVSGDDVSSTAVWCKYADTLLLIADGIATAGQGSGTIGGYVGGVFDSIASPVNAYFAAASAKLLSALPLGFLAHTNNVVFAGWSLGGCECMQVALDGRDAGMWAMPKIATFGSPRFSNAQVARRFEGGFLVRWMCDTDPVPLVPPRVADMPVLPAVYGIAKTLRLGNFVHAPGGVSIDSHGVIVDAEVSPLASPAFPLALGSWLLGADASAGSPHFIGSYVTRIQSWINAHPNNQSAVRIFTPIEPVGQAPRSHLSREQAAAETELFRNAAVQEEAVQKIPPQLLFKAVKVGRLWYVTINDTVVSIAPTKRRARGYANAGNDFLRRSLKEGYVDTNQLIQSMQAWITAAQDASSGITPLIASTLP